MKLTLPLVLLLLGASACARGDDAPARLVVAATTSIEDTGLLDALARAFRQAHPDIALAPVAVGTGQALELGRRGDADVLITHDSIAEVGLVASGIASERRSVMYNDFVIAGPAADPARARGSEALACLRAIAGSGAPFVSRGDDSGTHRKERSLWREVGLDPRGAAWYVEAGVGMGDALLLAAQKDAYVLTDRATFIRFDDRIDLAIICEDDPPLYNSYGVTVLDGPRRKSAEIFATWLTGEQAQRLIGEFGRAQAGRPLFTPSAQPGAGR